MQPWAFNFGWSVAYSTAMTPYEIRFGYWDSNQTKTSYTVPSQRPDIPFRMMPSVSFLPLISCELMGRECQGAVALPSSSRLNLDNVVDSLTNFTFTANEKDFSPEWLHVVCSFIVVSYTLIGLDTDRISPTLLYHFHSSSDIWFLTHLQSNQS